MKKLAKILQTIAYIFTVPATIILGILWFVSKNDNIEPIVVVLSALSIALVSLSQLLQREKGKPKSVKEMSRDELLELVQESDSKKDWNLVHGSLGVTAVYIFDPTLRIEHAYTKNYRHSDKFEEDWAIKFPDRRAVSEYYDLYYGSTRLERYILVWVDGGRAGLPLPESPYNLSVKKIRYNVAMIFDTSDSVNQYMTIAGFKIEE